MLKLTFKNVEQGDSIILEWEDDGISRIGLIDCKNAFRTNPTINFIKALNLTKIDFILLTHPHQDHFSGFSELLDYCIQNNIEIP